MKKQLTLFFLSVLALLLPAGCTNEIESDLNVLERRIEKLETRCQEINTTLQGLRTIMENLQEYDFLTSVEPITENGEIIGYVLRFTLEPLPGTLRSQHFTKNNFCQITFY